MDLSRFLDLIGKPFAEDGKGPDHFNCGELVLEIYRRAGLVVPRPEYDPEVVGTEHELFELSQSGDWTRVAPPFHDLDLLVLMKNGGAAGVHAGVYFSDNGGSLLHAQRDAGVAFEPWRRYRRKLLAAYRHKDLCHKSS